MTAPEPVYAIVVQAHLDDHWAAWLGNLVVVRNDDGTSTLTGPVTDQAELHGILARLRDLGVALIAVTPVGRATPVTRAQDLSTQRE